VIRRRKSCSGAGKCNPALHLLHLKLKSKLASDDDEKKGTKVSPRTRRRHAERATESVEEVLSEAQHLLLEMLLLTRRPFSAAREKVRLLGRWGEGREGGREERKKTRLFVLLPGMSLNSFLKRTPRTKVPKDEKACRVLGAAELLQGDGGPNRPPSSPLLPYVQNSLLSPSLLSTAPTSEELTSLYRIIAINLSFLAQFLRPHALQSLPEHPAQ